MKVLKLILNKYRRLFLNNIEKIEYTPEASVQVIIGRNMCGKSSLLKELTPLPAEVKREFKDGGYKEITIEHNNSIYKLLSKIENGKVSHSFLKDGIELNDGRTKKVQLELVKQHFGLTPDIVEILLNKNRFTTMSPFERKRWFSEMSSIDYTYPISVYNKIKSRHRDIVGGIKLSTDNVVSVEQKLQNTELIDKLKKDKEILEDIKKHINSLYVPDNNLTVSNEENYLNLVKKMDTMSRILDIPLETTMSKNEVNETISTNKIKLEHLKEEIEKTHKELDLIEISKKYGEEDKLKEELDKFKLTYDNLIKDMLSKINKEVIGLINNKLIYEDYSLYSTIAQDIISNVVNLSEYDSFKDYDKDKILEIKNEYSNLSNRLVALEKRKELITAERDKMLDNYMDNKNKVVCPNCDYLFRINYDEKVVNKCNTELELLDKTITETNKKVEDYKELLIKLEERLKLLENIKSIIRNNPRLKYVWITILSNLDISTANSESLLTAFNTYLVYLNEWKNITELEKQIEDVNNKLKFIEETRKMNISLEQSRIEVLNKKLFELNQSVKLIEEFIKKNNQYLIVLDNMSIEYNNLRKSIVEYKNNLNKLYIDIRNKHLVELYDKIVENINAVDAELNTFRSGKEMVENEKKKIEEYKIKEKVLRILEKELSPSEGLIAKSINSFLNIFVDEMNEVISNIWTYSIELLPCDIDNDNGYDLDYKFKVKVDNSEIIEDVGKLSSSGQEIVDLAYRLVFAKYMGLDSIPLMLDEFGSTFDKSHRTKAYEVIDKILGSEYGQIFLICHFESLYGTLRNMDVNVLDPNNIELGYVTEKNTKFKIN